MPNLVKTFSTPEPVWLMVVTRAGTIRVSATDTEVTRVRLDGEAAEDVVVEHDRRRVVVAAPRSRRSDPHLDVEVEVPAAGYVGVETGSADLVVVGDVEQVQAKSGSGDLSVERADDVHLTSGSGHVRVARVGSRARLRTGSGDIEVGVADGVAVWTDVRTGSGEVTSSVEGRGAPGRKEPYVDLRVSTGSGDVALVRAEGQPFIATPSRQ